MRNCAGNSFGYLLCALVTNSGDYFRLPFLCFGEKRRNLPPSDHIVRQTIIHFNMVLVFFRQTSYPQQKGYISFDISRARLFKTTISVNRGLNCLTELNFNLRLDCVAQSSITVNQTLISGLNLLHLRRRINSLKAAAH